MPGFQRRIPENPALRRFGGGLLPATLGQTVGAAFGDPRNRPSGLIGTQQDIARERGTLPAEERSFLVGPGGPTTLPEPVGEFREDEERLSRFVPAEKLNRRYKDIGLKFDRPERENVARIMAEQRRADLIRQDVIARGPGGVGAGALQLGAAFVSSAFDPLNIASAFVPVVSSARYAGFVARFGATRGRLLAGGIEGTVGAALVEPLVFNLSRQQQLDYEMSDALVNVAFGGLLGGGLHAIGGRLGDFLRRSKPATREAALKASVAQTAQGQHTDVGDVLTAGMLGDVPRGEIAEVRDFSRDFGVFDRFGAERRVAEPARTAEDIEPAGVDRSAFEDIDPILNALRRRRKRSRKGRRPESLVQFLVREGGIRDEGGELSRGLGITSRTRPGLINNKSGLPLDEAALRATEARFMGDQQGLGAQDAPGQERATPDDLLEAIDEEINRGRRRFRFEDEAASEEQRVLDQAEEELDRVGVDLDEMTNDQIKDALAFDQAKSAREVFASEQTEQGVRRLAERAANTARDARSDGVADFPASARIAENLDRFPGELDPDNVQADTELAREVIDGFRAQGLLGEATEREIGELDRFVERAADYGKAARQAAICMMGRT